MKPKKNLVNQQVGRLTVISEAGSIKTSGGSVKARWLCKCSCGNMIIIRAGSLLSGKTKSCGCLRQDTSRELRIQEAKHNHTVNYTQTPTYRTWRAMMGRCNNPNHKDYPKYGAAGISVSPHWYNFVNFLNDMGIRPTGKSIDRINGNLGYYKENCRWATAKEQGRNLKCNKLTESDVANIRADHRTQSVIAAEYCVSTTMISNIKRGKVWM